MSSNGIDSQCLICSRFFFGHEYEKCPHCGGLCAHYKSENVRLMGRAGEDYDRATNAPK